MDYATLKVMQEPLETSLRKLKERTERLREDRRQPAGEDPPGIVIVIDKEKRYGIIKTVAGRDIYFADKAVPHDDFDRIEIGTLVRYVDQPGGDGPRASTVEIMEKKGQPTTHPGPAT